MINRIRNGRNECAMFDDSSRRCWSGTNTDGESQMLGTLVRAETLVSQFFALPPHDGQEAARDARKAERVRTVASCCLRSQMPDLTPSDECERAAFSAVWQFTRRIRDSNEVLGVDHVLFADGAGAFAVADLVFRCNGRVFVCEWVVGDAMKPAKCKFNAPFSHLVADPITIASLKCSASQVLADAGGYFSSPSFAPARILWLHTEDGAWKVDAMACRDLRREAATMMLSRCYTPWYKEWSAACPF